MSFWSNKHGDTQEEVVANVATTAFSNITDSIIDTHSAIKVLAVTVPVELGAFLMLYISKDKVSDYLAESDTDLRFYGSIVAFVIGFLTAFAVYRLVDKRWPHPLAPVMIWFASIAAGAANVALFFVLPNFELR